MPLYTLDLSLKHPFPSYLTRESNSAFKAQLALYFPEVFLYPNISYTEFSHRFTTELVQEQFSQGEVTYSQFSGLVHAHQL